MRIRTILSCFRPRFRVASRLALVVLPGLIGTFPASVFAKLRVVTSSTNFAAVVREVGGEHVVVESIMRGNENPHNVIAKPSYIMMLRKADLFMHAGLDGEPWVPTLVKSARRKDLLPGGEANIDLSAGIDLKEVPAPGTASRAMGDIHLYGNTHYMLDPLNGVIVAHSIADALAGADPEHEPDYRARAAAFEARIRSLTQELQERVAPYAGVPVVVYHRSWPYFLDRFGFVSVGEVEPKPGVAPGPQHLKALGDAMKSSDVPIVIVEPFSSLKNAQVVAERAGARAVVLAIEVGGVSGADTYEQLFRTNIDAVISILEPWREAHQTTGAAE